LQPKPKLEWRTPFKAKLDDVVPEEIPSELTPEELTAEEAMEPQCAVVEPVAVSQGYDDILDSLTFSDDD
jgi:hypothetical protein